MNLQQMRCLSELVKQEFGVSATARALNAAQPTITKQLRELEEELAVPVLIRSRHRIVGVTPLGERIVKLATDVCVSVDTIRRLTTESTRAGAGIIRIGTTHGQAKCVLPEPMQRFSRTHPHVQFEIRQAQPADIVSLVASGDVDIGLTPLPDNGDRRVTFVAYRAYPPVILLPTMHPLAAKRHISLRALAKFPIITTGVGHIGRNDVLAVFAANRIDPIIQLSAPDFDIVKACVERGLGIAILPSYTYDAEKDKNICAVDASHLFPGIVSSVVLHSTIPAPTIVYRFLNVLMPGVPSRK